MSCPIEDISRGRSRGYGYQSLNENRPVRARITVADWSPSPTPERVQPRRNLLTDEQIAEGLSFRRRCASSLEYLATIPPARRTQEGRAERRQVIRDRSASPRRDSSVHQVHERVRSGNENLRAVNQRDSSTRERFNSANEHTDSGTAPASIFSATEAASSEPPTSPVPETANDPDGECTCPIGHECAKRASNGLLDCRSLVFTWNAWKDVKNQAEYDMYLGEPYDNAPTAPQIMIQDFVDQLIRLQEFGPARTDAIKAVCNYIKQWIEAIKFYNVTAEVLERTGVLNELDKFLDEGHRDRRQARRFPVVLEEELTVLLRKWKRGDLSCHPKRGLKENALLKNGQVTRTTYQLDKTWRHYKPAKHYGEGDLVNGQTFWSRLKMMRDGAHAAPVAGICGSIRKGACSIVMGYHDEKNQNFYGDKDMGTIIDYLGTALRPIDAEDAGSTRAADRETNIPDPDMEITPFQGEIRDPTWCTQMMMTSYRLGNPIRVIRSPRLATIVKNKPKNCFRYDGLYKVVRMIAKKHDRQIWCFRLVRLPGQGPLRGISSTDSGASVRDPITGYRRFNDLRYGRRMR